MYYTPSCRLARKIFFPCVMRYSIYRATQCTNNTHRGANPADDLVRARGQVEAFFGKRKKPAARARRSRAQRFFSAPFFPLSRREPADFLRSFSRFIWIYLSVDLSTLLSRTPFYRSSVLYIRVARNNIIIIYKAVWEIAATVSSPKGAAKHQRCGMWPLERTFLCVGLLHIVYRGMYI